MLINILLFILGLALLGKGASWLVEGSASLARKFGIPEFIVGITVVGFGTSFPEFIVNVIASIQGQEGDIVIGNVIGSNNFNLLFIIGISGLIAPLAIGPTTQRKEIPISFAAIVLLLFLANDDFLFHEKEAVLGRLDGIILLLFFVLFLINMLHVVKSDKKKLNLSDQKANSKRLILTVLLGLFALLLGGKIMVDSAIRIAQSYHMSKELIGLTIVSAGTSFPELATSIVAARKGKANLAIGNILGSNIFNILFILGVSVLIRPVDYSKDFNLDSLIMMLATIFLFISMYTGKKRMVDRWEALIFLIGSFCYLYYLIQRG